MFTVLVYPFIILDMLCLQDPFAFQQILKDVLHSVCLHFPIAILADP